MIGLIVHQDSIRAFSRATIAVLGLLFHGFFCARPCDAKERDGLPPNIVFILADDLGWRDLGCFGSTFHQTPNLDQLAARGVRFTQAYAANPLCSPTRSSILTGLWPARTGITAPVCHLPKVVLEKGLVPGNPNQPVLVAESVTRLSTDYVTLPKILKSAGYRTGHFGKWHLGPEPYSALQHGFDVDWPHWPGPGPAGSYVAPWKFPASLGIEHREGDHIEDRTSDQVVGFIRENKDRPFFVNYWQFSVHAPYDAKDKLVAKYRKLAKEDHPQRNPVYGAMVESLDDGVGKVMRALEETGIADRTIIVFFSDNGGISWGDKAGGQHKSARFQEDMGSPPTSNLPLRNGKASLYEGGVREPCIVVWPGVVRGGSTNDAMIQSIDWMPTLLEMANVERPKSVAPDGISIVPALRGGKLERDTLFTHFPHDTPASGQHPATSVRKGDWKLIRIYGQNEDGSDQLELYHLRDDLGESTNVASKHPELVKELNQLIETFLKETQAVVPKRNPNYKKSVAGASEAGGWRGSKDVQLTVDRDGLRLTSSGNDPWISTRDVPSFTGPFVVEWEMRSSASGDGQVLYSTAANGGFARGTGISFSPIHDGKFHTYRVEIPETKPLRALRLDPATGPGSIVLRGIQLMDKQGTTFQLDTTPK